MTETAAEGSVQPGAAAAGNPPSAQSPAENGSAAGTGSFLDGLSEGNRQLATNKGWTTPDSLDKAFTAYAELERKQGDALSVPKDDAPKEEWDKFHSRLGRPETPDKYEFKRPEGLPENLPYSEELAKASKPWMHEAGLSPRQAQTIHDQFVKYQADQTEAMLKQQGQAVSDTHDALVKEWGPKDSETFKQKAALMNRAGEKLGLTDAFKQSGIVLPDGSITNPQIARALAAVGEAMFKEDTIEARAAVNGENPFKRDANGKIGSPGAISALIKSDPERAKRMCRETGEKVSYWFPDNPN
jgi:hypothetical protein